MYKSLTIFARKFDVFYKKICQVLIICIRIYAASTINAEDEEVERFYDELENIIEYPQRKHLIIMGDFNSEVELRQEGEKNILEGTDMGKETKEDGD